MSYLLKNIYSPEFFGKLHPVFKATLPGYDAKKFNRLVNDKNWAGKELKDRMRHIATVLHHFLPQDFLAAAPVLSAVIKALKISSLSKASLQCMFLADYIERYGIDHFGAATVLFEELTPFSSCEFAVRLFILKYDDRMINTMKSWSVHPDYHVRRLASEGSRPRLPWAMALPGLKKDPGPVLPILENLKMDPSEYVRKSVANHLNDITKDNPDTVLAIVKSWKGKSKETDAIIKHGCRNLLKQGHPEILRFYGLNTKTLAINDCRVLTKQVRVGDDLAFGFSVSNSGRIAQHTRLEYAIYYLRQNGEYGKKVFKISEKPLAPGETLKVHKRQSFRLITTRKFYPGKQFVAVIVNGKESEKLPFLLK
jgi:3-methyladenine DNA glycosylase AlkC